MAAATKPQGALSCYRGRLFGLASQVWAGRNVEQSEELHALVEGITGKSSIKALDASEFLQVILELERRLPACSSVHAPSKVPAKSKARPTSMASVAQEAKAFRLMYELIKYDAVPDKSTAGVRLCGIIRKELHVDVGAKNPFEWVSAANARRLIDTMQGYVNTAAARALRGEVRKK